MAWFRNHYRCARCGLDWTDEWSCMCDDDCPHCGARHMSPDDSEDMTGIIVRRGARFFVLWSPESAEHYAGYQELASFATRKRATDFLNRTLRAASGAS